MSIVSIVSNWRIVQFLYRLFGITNKELSNATDVDDEKPLFIALHYSDPVNEKDQRSLEIYYPKYKRQLYPLYDSVASFPQCNQLTPVTVTHFSIGYNEVGCSRIALTGKLTYPVTLCEFATLKLTLLDINKVRKQIRENESRSHLHLAK